jgi:NADH-quinone oxidoreductase subunit G
VQRYWPALRPPPLARPAWQVLGVLLAGLDALPAPADAAGAFRRLSDWHGQFATLSHDRIGPHGALLSPTAVGAEAG